MRALLVPVLLLSPTVAQDEPHPQPGYTIPLLDLAADTGRQVVVDREEGQYLGHPTTVLLENGKTMLCVYPKGHGRGAVVFKRSEDAGLSWSERLPTPASWATSVEVPTLYRIDGPDGGKRLVMFSGLYPIRMAKSDDDGATWSELEPIGDFGGIVAMASLYTRQNGEVVALFHDDGRFLREGGTRANPPRFVVYQTVSADHGDTWSEPEVVGRHPKAHLCEPGIVRSPDGARLAMLLRENSRVFNGFVCFSDDEGRSWTEPRQLPGALTGDRHTAKYAPDGRLFVSFRDTTRESPTQGDWVGWVGTWEDIENGREGQYRVRLMDNHHRWDCAYPGVEVLPDGTFVCTTYGHWTEGEAPYVVSVRFTLEELDELATRAARLDLPRADAGRLERDILALAEHGKTEHGTWRVAFSPADIAGRAFVMDLMRAAGLQVRVDAAGNILGSRDGEDPDLPPILFGSHIDTVPRGGNYDGCVGVMCAIECIRLLDQAGIVTRHPLEVVVFADEEGGLVGSRAMAGILSEAALTVMSHSGKPIGLGILAIGGDPKRLDEAIRRPGDIAAYLEVHIEQGAVLHGEGIDIGVVEGIVGIQWWDVTIEGAANHAGTTPMDKRRDALLAASKLVIAVNEVVTAEPGTQVGTVGRIRAEPGAPNVIPGRVTLSLELRDLSAEKIAALFARIERRAELIAEQSGTEIAFELLDVTAIPAVMDDRVRSLISASAEELGLSHRSMPSGAGHDAQDMARIAPAGMIFVPSVDGISHAPGEFTSKDDMAKGADVLLHTILEIDRAEWAR